MGNVSSAAKSFGSLANNVNHQMESGDLSRITGLSGDLVENVNSQVGSQGIAGILGAVLKAPIESTPIQAMAVSKCVVTLATVSGAGQTRPLGSTEAHELLQSMDNITDQLKGMNETSSLSANLEYRRTFGLLVYDFLSQQILYADRPNHKGEVKDLFFVFHPGDDWHPGFWKKMQEAPLAGFAGLCTSLDGLGIFLSYNRKSLDADTVIHILLPSMQPYVLPGQIEVSKHLLPLRVVGQLDRTGHPYVYATILGLDDESVQGVHQLPRPQTSDNDKGGFSSTSHDLHLDSAHVLAATCQTSRGNLVQSKLNLDNLLGVDDDGTFDTSRRNFSRRATSTRIDASGGKAILRASLTQKAGPPVESSIDLDSIIKNKDGRLMRHDQLSRPQKAASTAAGATGGVVGGAVGSAVAGPIGGVAGGAVGAMGAAKATNDIQAKADSKESGFKLTSNEKSANMDTVRMPAEAHAETTSKGQAEEVSGNNTAGASKEGVDEVEGAEDPDKDVSGGTESIGSD